jgi:adenylylsulfate kinase
MTRRRIATRATLGHRLTAARRLSPRRVPMSSEIEELRSAAGDREEEHVLAKGKSTNITWHESHVTRNDREEVLCQKGVTIWLTGLSGSGKSTIAVAAERALVERGRLAYVLDGDNIRHGLNSNLGFSPDDRSENIRRIGEVAKLFTDSGVIVFASFISPYRADRDNVRSIMNDGDFIEVLINASLETCENRDAKGLYQKARAGEIPEFTGISAPYEAPANPEVVLDTNTQTVAESVAQLVDYLETSGYLGAEAPSGAANLAASKAGRTANE